MEWWVFEYHLCITSDLESARQDDYFGGTRVFSELKLVCFVHLGYPDPTLSRWRREGYEQWSPLLLNGWKRLFEENWMGSPGTGWDVEVVTANVMEKEKIRSCWLLLRWPGMRCPWLSIFLPFSCIIHTINSLLLCQTFGCWCNSLPSH